MLFRDVYCKIKTHANFKRVYHTDQICNTERIRIAKNKMLGNYPYKIWTHKYISNLSQINILLKFCLTCKCFPLIKLLQCLNFLFSLMVPISIDSAAYIYTMQFNVILEFGNVCLWHEKNFKCLTIVQYFWYCQNATITYLHLLI